MSESDDCEADEPSSGLEPPYQAIPRADGVTAAERYLQRLCEGSFLRLWSYPGVYRDQGNGKEIADLLVVFGKHIIIFSDKSCAYPNTGNPDVDWKRWFKKAVLKSAEQTWGAERWILDHPQRVFLDRACKVRFPIAIPPRGEAVVHRVVVAHNVAEPCRREHGGSGSLILLPALGSSDELRFTVGDLDPSKGFVHVLDDHSLDIVLQTIDTVADFTEYLSTKEAFIRAGHLLGTPGEEELLALYLQNGDARKHAFPLPPGMDQIGMEEGFWDEFTRNPRREAQVAANEISYVWDRLIGEFETHLLAGTSAFRSHDSLHEMEPVLRVMASENRTMRRHLASQLMDVLHRPLANNWQPNVRLAAAMDSEGDSLETIYVFVSAPRRPGATEEAYREERRGWLNSYAYVARLLNPTAKRVLGLAMEPLPAGSSRSEDVLLLRSEDWNEELEAEARRLNDRGLLQKVNTGVWHIVEYPPVPASRTATPAVQVERGISGRDRNKPCHCGSGKKLKKCHGAT